MGLTTYLCEKPSQALVLSKILGLTKTDKQSCHYFNSKKQICILPARGHLFELAPPEFYDDKLKKGWKLSSLPVIPKSLDDFKVLLKDEFTTLFDVFKKRLSDTDLLYICTDPDAEGELIARDIIDFAEYSGERKRILCSSTLEVDLKKALSTPFDVSETASQAISADLRRKFDWLIGMNGTMSATSKLKALSKLNKKSVFNVGRVITALSLIVNDRENQIIDFKPTKFYKIIARCSCKGLEFDAELDLPTSITNSSGYLTSKQSADKIISALPNSLKVLSVKEESKTRSAPLPFDLGSLQEAAGKLDISPERTLQIIQVLYDQPKSALTYPRTECQYLPEAMMNDVKKIIGHLNKSIPIFKTLKLDLETNHRCFNDSKVEVHHGIVPTTKHLNLNHVTDAEKAIYLLVAKRFIQQFMEKFSFKKTDVLLGTNKFKFKCSGNQIINLGWKSLDDTNSRESILPEISNDSDIKLVKYFLKEGTTQPPKRFTQAQLIGVMKNPSAFVRNDKYRELVESSKGIGTSATRGDVIKRAVSSGLIDASKSTVRPGKLITKYASRLSFFSVEASVVMEEKLRQASIGELDSSEVFRIFSAQTTKQVAQWQNSSS